MFTYEERGHSEERQIALFEMPHHKCEKNAHKLQIDKTRGNMSSICLWLDIFKQDES